MFINISRNTYDQKNVIRGETIMDAAHMVIIPSRLFFIQRKKILCLN